jgi:hypothetical protein
LRRPFFHEKKTKRNHPLVNRLDDFRTINRFRSERMKDVLEKVFTTILGFLVKEKYVKLEHYFVDGTKIEANANANKYRFVWGKAVVKHRARLQEKVKTLFTHIEEAERQEEQEHHHRDLLELGEASTSPVKS